MLSIVLYLELRFEASRHLSADKEVLTKNVCNELL